MFPESLGEMLTISAFKCFLWVTVLFTVATSWCYPLALYLSHFAFSCHRDVMILLSVAFINRFILFLICVYVCVRCMPESADTMEAGRQCQMPWNLNYRKMQATYHLPNCW